MSILDPQKWDLLHQEGALLLEQISRKMNTFDSTIKISQQNALPQPQIYLDNISYLERSMQRLFNLQNEYLAVYEIFQGEVKNIRVSITQKFSNAAAAQPRASRGVCNLETSPTDVLVTYDFILSLYYRELTNKLDILSLFITITTSKLDQHLLISNSYHSRMISNDTGVSSITQTTDPALPTSTTIPNYHNMIELYPWVEQIFNQTNPCLSDEDKETKDVLFKSQLVDLNGIIALFYKRPGFDLAQLNRLTSTIKTILAMAAQTGAGSIDTSSTLAEIIKTHSTFSSPTI